MPQHKSHPLYHAVLMLYPKAHRQEYGEQMLLTFDDLLSEHQDFVGKLGVWSRVAFELPQNLAEEHINNIKGMRMGTIKPTTKKVMLAVGAMTIIAVVGVVVLVLTRHDQYTPTTLAKVTRSTPASACIQSKDNPDVSVNVDDTNFIGNTVATSIIDVPAGTNVDVHFKSYDGTHSSGTAVYGGKYGSYNYIAKKTVSNSSNSYVGGWEIVHLEACKA